MLFRVVIPLFVLSLQALLFLRFYRWAHDRPHERYVIWLTGLVLFLIFNAGVIAIILLGPRSRHLPDWLVHLGVVPFFVWHTATFFIALVLIIGNLIGLPFRLLAKALGRGARKSPRSNQRLSSSTEHDPVRRAILRRGMYGVTAAAFGGTAYGMLVENKHCDITEEQFTIPSWPRAMSGFTIGFVSDIHSSLYMRKQDMDEYVSLLNSLKPDLFVIGGDMANSLVDEIFPFTESFSELKAPLGVYAVLGNHDFYTRQPDTITRHLEEAGIRVLRNERLFIRKNGASFHLMGIDDASNEEQAGSRFDRAIGTTSTSLPRIMVCHRPYYFEKAAQRKIHLMLSGHTHGGQLVFGRFGNTVFTPAALSSPYVWGRYKMGNSQMYVSRGLGTVAVPIRLNCPPEITKIVIRSPRERPPS